MLIEAFLCRTDNLAVLIHDKKSGKTAAVDAPDGQAIANRLAEKGWHLDTILVTHHHADHTEGIAALKEKTGATVIGPEAEKYKINRLDRTVKDGDTVQFASCMVETITTPGHTAGSISFYLPEQKLLFTGDTLFSLGCGRLFEGTPAMMLSSLQKLRQLPGDTQIYCGHEYTQSNGTFALTIEPQNEALQNRMADVVSLRSQGKLTLPSTLALECATNPFLRWDVPDIQKNLNLAGASDEAVFTELRKRKDTA